MTTAFSAEPSRLKTPPPLSSQEKDLSNHGGGSFFPEKDHRYPTPSHPSSQRQIQVDTTERGLNFAHQAPVTPKTSKNDLFTQDWSPITAGPNIPSRQNSSTSTSARREISNNRNNGQRTPPIDVPASPGEKRSSWRTWKMGSSHTKQHQQQESLNSTTTTIASSPHLGVMPKIMPPSTPPASEIGSLSSSSSSSASSLPEKSPTPSPSTSVSSFLYSPFDVSSGPNLRMSPTSRKEGDQPQSDYNLLGPALPLLSPVSQSRNIASPTLIQTQPVLIPVANSPIQNHDDRSPQQNSNVNRSRNRLSIPVTPRRAMEKANGFMSSSPNDLTSSSTHSSLKSSSFKTDFGLAPTAGTSDNPVLDTRKGPRLRFSSKKDYLLGEGRHASVYLSSFYDSNVHVNSTKPVEDNAGDNSKLSKFMSPWKLCAAKKVFPDRDSQLSGLGEAFMLSKLASGGNGGQSGTHVLGGIGEMGSKHVLTLFGVKDERDGLDYITHRGSGDPHEGMSGLKDKGKWSWKRGPPGDSPNVVKAGRAPTMSSLSSVAATPSPSSSLIEAQSRQLISNEITAAAPARDERSIFRPSDPSHPLSKNKILKTPPTHDSPTFRFSLRRKLSSVPVAAPLEPTSLDTGMSTSTVGSLSSPSHLIPQSNSPALSTSNLKAAAPEPHERIKTSFVPDESLKVRRPPTTNIVQTQDLSKSSAFQPQSRVGGGAGVGGSIGSSPSPSPSSSSSPSSAAPRIILLLEFCPYGHVLNFAKSFPERLGKRRWFQWARELCSAVAWAHERCILHADIKPQNVLIAADMSLRLADFGMSLFLPHPGSSIPPPCDPLGLGTPAYSPPEFVMTPPSSFSFPSDIFSLGVTLSVLLTAREPYEGMRAMGRMLQVSRGGYWEWEESQRTGGGKGSSELDNDDLYRQSAPPSRTGSIRSMRSARSRELSGQASGGISRRRSDSVESERSAISTGTGEGGRANLAVLATLLLQHQDDSAMDDEQGGRSGCMTAISDQVPFSVSSTDCSGTVTPVRLAPRGMYAMPPQSPAVSIEGSEEEVSLSSIPSSYPDGTLHQYFLDGGEIVPFEVRNLLRKMTRPDPKERPSVIEVLQVLDRMTMV